MSEDVIPLDALASTSVDALLEALVVSRGAPSADKKVNEIVRALVITVLRRTLDGPRTLGDDYVELGMEALRVGTAPIREAWVSGPPAGSKPYTGVNAVDSLSRTMGYLAMEQWDVRAILTGGPNGWVLRCTPLTAEGAHLALLDVILKLLHRFALEDPLLKVERAASGWWFRRLDPTAEDDERAAARATREYEWSLTERKSMATGKTVLELACERGFLETLGPRSRRMARFATQSRMGVFSVRVRSGANATVLDVGKREQLTLREDEKDKAPEPGTVIVGRLYPYDGDVYLRSPGAFVFGPGTCPPARKVYELARVLERRHFPMATALESVVRAAILDPGVEAWPERPPAAATSAAKARRVLDVLRRGMEETGMLEQPQSKGAMWLEPSRKKGGVMTVFGWETDLGMALWVEELMEVAGIGREVRRGSARTCGRLQTAAVEAP